MVLFSYTTEYKVDLTPLDFPKDMVANPNQRKNPVIRVVGSVIRGNSGIGYRKVPSWWRDFCVSLHQLLEIRTTNNMKSNKNPLNEGVSDIQIESLQSSTLFQLSLSSKELFHSNFLAWLFKAYPEASSRALSPYIRSKSASIKKDGGVKREQNNRDLTIDFDNGEVLIIENKVKSLPYIEQLENYAENAPNNSSFLLLTLTPFEAKTSNSTWHVLTYKNLPLLLQKIQTEVSTPYGAALLDDYINFVSVIGQCFDIELPKNSDLFNFHVREEDKVLDAFLKIGMADLYQKRKYGMLAQKALLALRKELPQENIVLDNKRGNNQITLGYGMTRATGLMEVRIPLHSDWELIVQIQGDSYKQMIVGPTKYVLSVAEALHDKGLWFDFSHLGQLQEYPKKGGFNKYAGPDRSVYYRRISLGTKRTIGNIVDMLVHDTKHALEVKDEIVKVIKK